MKKHYCVLALVTTSLALASCEKEIIDQSPLIDSRKVYYKPTTPQEIKLVENIGKVTNILKILYQDPMNLKVVNAAIKSQTYTDESILFKDLIYPDNSRLSSNPRFHAYAQNLNLSLVSFASNFWTAAQRTNDPEFISFLKSLNTSNFGSRVTGVEESPEITIYFPYSKEFIHSEDNPTGDVTYGPVTNLVAATADADVALGTQAYTDASGIIQYRTVVVDDDFAYHNPTHIIGLNGIEPYSAPDEANRFDPNPSIFLPGIPREIKQVYVGDVKCKKQYDALISTTGNGGGSEIRFTRADGFLKLSDGQVQADMYVTGERTIDRWHIRNKRFDEYISEWDGDWESSNLNENLAIYEEDTRNSVEVNGSLTTTLTISMGNTASGTIGFKGMYKSDDNLITQTNLVHSTFFFLNRIDLEGEMYNQWPVRNRTSDVSYTLQDRTFRP